MAATTTACDEPIELSKDTLEALRQFYSEQDDRQKQFEDLNAQATEDADLSSISMDLFAEDWNASQFWYDDETASILASQLLEDAKDSSTIGFISAPSVFVQFKKLMASGAISARPQIYLFEFDKRFAVFKEFIHYDFKSPTRLPAELKGKFDRIICDPPFLSVDCQTKVAITVRWLTKAPEVHSTNEKLTTTTASVPPFRLIACTGERMESLVTKLYRQAGIRKTSFEPRHAKGLSNEFRCYANFECDAWRW
ncbi:MAG: hypothetical protein M1813_005863 [Trichoglossum hirsutum]|nr:MAG: hypothetical protein M1813_005863 [Trichoglossum hirsutum]